MTALLFERTQQYNRMLGPQSIDPYTADADIEKFDMFENLMIGAALQNFDCDVVRTEVAPGTLQGHWPEVLPLIPAGRVDGSVGIPDYNATVTLTRSPASKE